jgi:hypothetical protein
MLNLITKSGKIIGRISDSLDESDILVVDGKEVKLDDVYSDDATKKSFNNNVKEFKDVVKEDEKK